MAYPMGTDIGSHPFDGRSFAVMTRGGGSSGSRGSGADITKPTPTRSFHRKVKTGCITCKARRVRCDEMKPACQRCTSTGRKCDGYITPSSSAPDPSRKVSKKVIHRSEPMVDATTDLSLTVLPRKNTNELRSYRYFLDMAAPCLAGSFDVAFWTDQVPRACYDDPALWHAVVSLGSVFETYSQLLLTSDRNAKLRGTSPDRNIFALQQFNLSIRHLTDPALTGFETGAIHASSCSIKWRTLVVCFIYMAICTLEGLYDDAHMHFVYGSSLLREIEAELSETNRKSRRGKPGNKKTTAARIDSPISLEALRSLMGTFELRDKVHYEGSDLTTTHVHLDSDVYTAWKAYSDYAPAQAVSRDAGGQGLTVTKLTEACNASQSLMNAFIMAAVEYAADPNVASTGQAENITIPFTIPSLLRSFYNIGAATEALTRDFEADLASGKKKRGHGKTDQLQMRLLLLCLRQSYATIRLMLAHLPPSPSAPGHDDTDQAPQDKTAFGPGCDEVLEMTEEILDLQHALRESRLVGASVPAIIKPPILINVFVIALQASTLSLRRRALALLKRPLLEGLLEHAMVTSLIESIMEREVALTREFRLKDAGVTDDSLASRDDEEAEPPSEDETIDPRAKTYMNKMRYIGRREAILEMWTFQEHSAGQRGSTQRVVW